MNSKGLEQVFSPLAGDFLQRILQYVASPNPYDAVVLFRGTGLRHAGREGKGGGDSAGQRMLGWDEGGT